MQRKISIKFLGILFLLSAGLLPHSALSQSPTWATDVAPIIYANCATCHRDGGIAPFSLMSYGEASTFSYSIKAATQSGEMPPWPPDQKYQRYAHERTLSQQEIKTLAAWVDAGAPQGDMADAPMPPVFSSEGELAGTPDLTLRIPTYTSPAATGDVYRCFVLDPKLTSDQFLAAFEAIPGNSAIVHHVLVYADTSGIPEKLDANDPGPGYTAFGGIGSNDAVLLGAWVPGTQPMKFPQGFGVKIDQKSKIVVQIHYPAGSIGQSDSTRMRFYFGKGANFRELYIIPALNHWDNIKPALAIAPNTVRNFTEYLKVPPFVSYSLMGVAPHMHLIGTKIKTYGVEPDGDTARYISIPHWDFHWQGFYLLQKVMKIPGGTELWSEATYDNTTANHHNPSNPPKFVRAGEATTDEMMITYFIVSEYQAGDEDIIIDSSGYFNTGVAEPRGKSHYFVIAPNPAQDQFRLTFAEGKPAVESISLIALDGKETRLPINTIGANSMEIDAAGFAAGIYLLKVQSAQGTETKRLVLRGN